MKYTVYQLPGTDARVAIAADGARAALAFLAKGRSRRADGSYTERNPERRALFLHMAGKLSTQCSAEWPWEDRTGDVVASKGGPSSAPVVRHNLHTPEQVQVALQKAHSAAGNYRLDLEVCLHASLDADTLASAWGLEPCPKARAPKDVRWLR